MPDGSKALEILKARGFVQTSPGVFRQRAGGWKRTGKGKSALSGAAAAAGGAGAPGAGRVRAAQLERGNAAASRKKAPAHADDTARYVVRVKCFRVRPIDDDNLCEKFVVDGLRYAGLIPDDRHQQTRIVTWQERAPCRDAERTEITVSRRI